MAEGSGAYDFLIPYHGWFMTTAFAIILPAGILMPILFKRTKFWSVMFWPHVLINTLGVLFATAGVAMGAKLYRDSTPQFVHRGIGIAVITFLWFQVVATLASRPFLRVRGRAKGAYYVLHRWLGATAFIVGVGNAYYGMNISAPATRYFVGYSVALGGWIIIAALGQLFVVVSQTKNTNNSKVPIGSNPNGTVAHAETMAGV